MSWPAVFLLITSANVYHVYSESDPPLLGLVVSSFAVFVDVSLNKVLNKQPSCRRFETRWRSCDVTVISQARQAFWEISPMFFIISFWNQILFVRYFRADSRLAPRQWETTLQSNAVSHWLSNSYPPNDYAWRSFTVHDDDIKWKHFPRNWPFVRGIHRSPVNSPHKGQWHGALMFSLICVWINDWVNNREAGDLRRYRAHYDVIVMNCTAIDEPLL